ncbi:MAG: adenine-specific methyltransferase EcoRI family protein [Planctomycetaceae bacterium]|nr:adenine-specific methyltransferase EcoRI family protein [Planctomycetaceae bacterium]
MGEVVDEYGMSERGTAQQDNGENEVLITGRTSEGNMTNTKLSQAKSAKNDEFYTQWADIEREVQAYLEFDPDVFRDKTILCPCDDPYESNFFKYFALKFKEFKLKKLIATCYAGSPIANVQLSLFDEESEENKTTRQPHKIEITEVPDLNNDGSVDLEDVELLLASDRNHLTRLKGDGDFRSDEIKKLRDEADIIITNPPFSLFREFLAWIVEADKQFLVIANMNAITYKEVFPLIKNNKIWLGATGNGSDMVFAVPKGFEIAEKDREKAARLGYVGDYTRLGNSCWFTNLDHGRRHLPLELMTMADIFEYSRHKEIRGRKEYDKYDNYDAIEVPFTDAIPDDYDGAMGVPISFLDKYCPEQFEILGITKTWFGGANKTYSNQIQVNANGSQSQKLVSKLNDGAAIKVDTPPLNETYYIVDGAYYTQVYARILIQHKRATK